MTVFVYPAICQMTQKSLSSDTGRHDIARLGFGSSPLCLGRFGEGRNGDCTATRLKGPGVLWQSFAFAISNTSPMGVVWCGGVSIGTSRLDSWAVDGRPLTATTACDKKAIFEYWQELGCQALYGVRSMNT